MWVGGDLNHGLTARAGNTAFVLARLIAPGNTFVAADVTEGNSLAQDKAEAQWHISGFLWISGL